MQPLGDDGSAAETEARTLEELCGAPMEVGAFLRLAVRIASALAEVHARQVVHKNIQPRHILIHPATGEATISGFRHHGPLIEGSLAYMSPEQAGRLNRPTDGRSDLYSLGVTFYRMLTGALPFHGADPLEWVHCHVARIPPSPLNVVPQTPPVVAEIVLKLLAKPPEERYQTTLGLQADLERCLKQWEAEGRIDWFRLGQTDCPDRLPVLARLYGRDAELAVLQEAYARAASTGRPAMVLISGQAGVGKTSLAREFQRTVAAAEGFFVSGKFDQRQWETPYAALQGAFGELINRVLAEPDERLAVWCERLREAAGHTASCWWNGCRTWV